MSIKIGLMGFGRIGRNIFRILYKRRDMRIEAISDIADHKGLEYLLRFDTILGRFPDPVSIKDGHLYVAGREIKMLSGEKPGEVPWGDLGVDIVVSATGRHRSRKQLERHLTAGAKRVILTVPAKDKVDRTIVLGVNDDALQDDDIVVSNASCTTNCLAPVSKVLQDNFGIVEGLMTTVHAYTNDQRIHDFQHSDLRRARAAALSIIPTTTGAAKAVGLVLPELAGRLEGIAVRVPTPDVSLVDLVVYLEREASVEEINGAMKAAAEGPLKGILAYTEEPLVSSDYIGDPHSSIFDAPYTKSYGKFAKVLSWYDNEWGYSCRTADLIAKLF